MNLIKTFLLHEHWVRVKENWTANDSWLITLFVSRSKKRLRRELIQMEIWIIISKELLHILLYKYLQKLYFIFSLCPVWQGGTQNWCLSTKQGPNSFTVTSGALLLMLYYSTWYIWVIFIISSCWFFVFLLQTPRRKKKRRQIGRLVRKTNQMKNKDNSKNKNHPSPLLHL